MFLLLVDFLHLGHHLAKTQGILCGRKDLIQPGTETRRIFPMVPW